MLLKNVEAPLLKFFEIALIFDKSKLLGQACTHWTPSSYTAEWNFTWCRHM